MSVACGANALRLVQLQLVFVTDNRPSPCPSTRTRGRHEVSRRAWTAAVERPRLSQTRWGSNCLPRCPSPCAVLTTCGISTYTAWMQFVFGIGDEHVESAQPASRCCCLDGRIVAVRLPPRWPHCCCQTPPSHLTPRTCISNLQAHLPPLNVWNWVGCGDSFLPRLHGGSSHPDDLEGRAFIDYLFRPSPCHVCLLDDRRPTN